MSPFRRPTTSWTFSRFSQKPGAALCCSMASICDFLPTKSKRVPELENPLLNALGPIDQFVFHEISF
jgi:hypothetical protein